MADLLRQFTEDPTVILMAVLVGLDVILGVSAAIVNDAQKFKLVLVSDFLRADVLGKLVPYYGLWAAVHLTGDIDIAGFGLIEETTGGIAIAALAASILNSLRDLGLAKSAPDAIAANDPTTPG